MARMEAAAPVSRHGRVRPRGPWGRVLGVVAGVAVASVVTAGSVAAFSVNQLLENTEFVELADGGEAPPQIGAIEGGTNLLIVGIDSRKDTGRKYASRSSSVLNDVNMLVHISEDQKNVYAISFPRDLIVAQPSCKSSPGWTTALNVAWSRGGLPCVVKVVESLTGMKIPYAATITFGGVIDMSNAVGGVQVCVSGGPIIDKHARVGRGKWLRLKTGKHTIKGPTALAYLRVRYGVGDGSDLSRISTQQTYLSSLVRKVKSDETLTNPQTIYNLAQAATRNMTLSSSLGSVDTIYSLVRILSKVDMERIIFLSYPGKTGSKKYPGKVEPLTADADALFKALKAGKTVVPKSGNTGRGSTVKSRGDRVGKGAVTLPSTVAGQLATDVTCSIGNPGGGY